MITARTWLAVLLCAAAPVVIAAQEYHDLFDGKDLDGWVVEGPKTDRAGRPMWSVQDGRIVCLGKGFGFLRYGRQQFGDFDLRVEYRFTPPSRTNPRGNSGLGIRTIPYDPRQTYATRPSHAAFEIQLLDDAGRPPGTHGTGSLYRYVAPTANPVKPAPAWNTVEVECVGPQIRVTLNGQKILDVDQKSRPEIQDKPLRGSICLQSHTGRVEFRKVQIREIPTKKLS